MEERRNFFFCRSPFLFFETKNFEHTTSTRKNMKMRNTIDQRVPWKLTSLYVGQHRGPVRALAFSPDGSLLLSGSNDRTMKLMSVTRALEHFDTKSRGEDTDPQTRKPCVLHTFHSHADRDLLNNSGGVTCLRFHPFEGSLIASGSNNGLLLFHRLCPTLLDHQPRFDRLTPHQALQMDQPLSSLDFHPCGSCLAVGTAFPSANLRLIDLESSNLDQFLSPEISRSTGAVNGVRFSPSGQLLASASADGSLNLWDAVSFSRVQSWRPHLGSVFSVEWCGDSSCFLITAGADGVVMRWDLRFPSEAVTKCNVFFASQSSFSSKCLPAVSSLCSRFVVAPDQNPRNTNLQVWDLESSKMICRSDGHRSFLHSCAASQLSDLSVFASGSDDHYLRLWQLSQ